MPVLLTQVRDQSIVPAHIEHPLPVLQTPYYLGLSHREQHPGQPTHPPTLPTVEPRFVELLPSILAHEATSIFKYSSSSGITTNSTDTTNAMTTMKPSKVDRRNTMTPSRIVEQRSNSRSEENPGSTKKWMDNLEFCSAFK